MEIDGQAAEVVPQAEMTSENYYFDSYSHFGKRICLYVHRDLQQQTPPAPACAGAAAAEQQ
jgi:hypothetical protein